MTPESSLRPCLARVRVPAAAIALGALTLSACGGSPAGTGSATPTVATSGSGSPSPAAPSTGGPSASGTVAAVPVESNPPGDIPDNLAFVGYTNGAGHYSFTHPEGWAQVVSGSGVRFTDKLNGVAVTSLPAAKAPTVSTARSTDTARIKAAVPAFELRGITAVTVPGGPGVRIVYRRNSAADPVTGKVYRDEVQEYDVFHAGRLVRMTLFGPVGADNVDAYRTMAQSVRIR